MNNESMVLSSPEKIHSHALINKALFKWIKFHVDNNKSAQVITMPASSGRQERQILEFMAEVGNMSYSECTVKLKTFDNRFEAHETGIPDYDSPCNNVWKHYKCMDIFRKILKLTKHKEIVESPTAAWFDLCGGLTDSNYEGMREVVSNVFADGSLLCTTLAIDNIRGMSKDSIISKMYASFNSGILRRKIATDIVLNELVESTGKYLRPVFEPYVYRRNGAATTYAVFGYIVGTHDRR